MSILDDDCDICRKEMDNITLKVARIFHPVGQGGFYTELFSDDEKSIVVYDCGGSSSRFMEKYLESFLPKSHKQLIEAVFISHLHTDHINGLQYLLDNATVKRIFLPQLTKDNIFEVLFYNAINSTTGNNTNALIVSLVKKEVKSKITEISSEETQERSCQLGDVIAETLPSGTKIQWKDKRWVYIPYNPTVQVIHFDNVDKSYRDILERIYNKDSVEMRAEAIADFIQGHDMKICKKIYKQLFGGIHNSQSMTVFSGLLQSSNNNICVRSNIFRNSSYPCVCWNGKCCEYSDSIIPTNFLYTGDFEAKNPTRMSTLKSFYQNHHNVWDTICGVQIPHHGSRYNYNQELYEGLCFAIGSAGTSNKYHHPHIDTLINIFQQRCMPFVVTEQKNTIIFQQIKIV